MVDLAQARLPLSQNIRQDLFPVLKSQPLFLKVCILLKNALALLGEVLEVQRGVFQFLLW